MPRPSEIHRQKPLENVSIGYKPSGFIAGELSTTVPVKHESDSFYVYTKDNFRIEAGERADGAPAVEVTFGMTTSTYTLTEFAYKDIITDRMRDNADAAIRLDIDATENLTDKVLLRREQLLGTLVGTAANWGNATSLTSTFAWSANTTLSNPIAFVDSATTVIQRQAGKAANVVAMDLGTFKAAKEHLSITDRIKYTSPDSITEGMLAKLFNVGKVLVSRASFDSSSEGIFTSTAMGFLWTDCAFVAYIEPSPGLKKASALYTFVQEGGSAPYKVRKWYDDERRGDMIEVSTMFQHRAVASDCAYLIVNTVQ